MRLTKLFDSEPVLLSALLALMLLCGLFHTLALLAEQPAAVVLADVQSSTCTNDYQSGPVRCDVLASWHQPVEAASTPVSTAPSFGLGP
jgi:hypothetical protein